MLHRLGTGKPIGSLQTFSNALANSIEASGAKIHLNAPVSEILIEGGETKGVRLEDGRVIRAKVVITRSEEHTSELQSLMRISYAVFCLKKKRTHQINTNKHVQRLKQNLQTSQDTIKQ